VGASKQRLRVARAVVGGLISAVLLAWPGAAWLAAQPFNAPAPQPGQPSPQPSQPATPAPGAPSPFQPIPGAPQQNLPPQKVVAVEIRGNDHVPTDQVLAVVTTKVGDPLNEDNLRNDVQAIQGLGLFADAVLRLEPVSDGVTVVFIVAENPVVTGVTVTGNTVVSTDDIRKALAVATGQVLNTVAMRQGAQAVERLYQGQGYVLARVSDISVDDKGVVSIVISEGRVEAIKIDGLHKAKDYVVRRELTFKPGDVFNANAVNASLKKLFALQYFSDVRAEPGPGTTPDTVDVTVTVTEQRTATASFGIGYGTTTGASGLVGLQDRDFGGNGQTASAEYDSTVLNGNNFVLGFTEPYFEGTRTVLAVQAYNQTTLPTDYTYGLDNSFQYTMYQTGGLFTFTQPMHTGPDQYLQYGAKTTNTQFGPSILTTSTVPSGFVFTPGTVNALLLGGSQDTRNDKVTPSSGQVLSLTTESAFGAIGSDFSFEKYEFDFLQYWPSGGDAVVVGHVHLGSASGPLPLQEEYYLGGQSSLRGYPAGRFRGDQMVLMTGEYRFPMSSLPFLHSFSGITGILFVDAGDTEPYPIAPTNFKSDVGFGLATKTPIGLFRIDFGYGSEGGQLWISTGTTF